MAKKSTIEFVTVPDEASPFREDGSGNPLVRPANFARSMILVASLSPNAATHGNLYHTVLAEQVAPIGAPQNDLTEMQELERVPCREALNLALGGAIMRPVHVASLMLGLSAAGKINL